MRYCCPDHIDGFCQPVIDESPFHNVRDKFANKHHFIYQVKCDCGCYVFRILCDKHPTLVAICPNCGKQIPVFDLKEYTTASQPEEVLEGILLRSNGGGEMFQICAMYEYGEEYREDAADSFDFNDVSWGSVWAFDESTRKITMVLDEEIQ